MPAFKQHGILVYFAAWAKHIGMYPPISGNKTLEKAIARYAGPKGNLTVSARQANSVRLDRPNRETAGETGYGKGAARRKRSRSARKID